MKKFKNHIIGVLIGIISFALYASYDFIAYGQVSSSDTSDEIVLKDISWADVFGPSSDSYDLYYLVYNDVYNNTKSEAVKQVAKKYGLSYEEALQTSQGSLSAIYHNEATNTELTTLEGAYNKYYGIINDYNELYELSKLEQELNTFSEASEIFADGDRLNSGFDLLYDLDQIEKILFAETSPVTVGTFNPFSEDDNPNKNLPEPYQAISNKNVLNLDEEAFNKLNETANSTGNKVPRNPSNTTVADEVEIKNLDVCEDDTGFLTALSDFEENKLAEEEKIKTEEVANNGNVDANADSSVASQTQNSNNINSANGVQPFKASSWAKSFCPGIYPESSKTSNGISYVFGSSGFNSLSSLPTNILNENLSFGIGASAEKLNSSVKFMFCLSTEMVYESYSTYYPDGSCVKCEISKINENLNEVLSHSLIPNKVTGNYMESSLCKAAFEPALDMKIVAIAAPVRTPANYDLIAEKNIYEEWNTFIDTYRPFLSDFGQIDNEVNSKFILKNAPVDSSLANAMTEINKINANELSKAVQEIENMSYVNDAQNINSFNQALFLEITEMKNLFASMQTMFKNIDENSCLAIIEKPNI